MLEFGGLWKRQNNPACTNGVRVLKLDTILKKKIEGLLARIF